MIPLANGFEETEAIAPADVLSRAGIEPILAHLPGCARAVRGSHALVLEASRSLADVSLDEVEGVFLPGGMPGTNHLLASREVREVVREAWRRGLLIAAICAAPRVLQEVGILLGRRVTSHPSCRDAFEGCVYDESPVVVDRPFITSRGPGTALWCGVTMVACLKGREAAHGLAEAMVIDVPAFVEKEWERWGPSS